jgi:hypothetical protein
MARYSASQAAQALSTIRITTMSQLDGIFSLRTPKDLREKLEADFKRLRAANPTSVDAQYAAFDFFVTAEHLPDWLFRSIGGTLSQHRTYTDGLLVSHLANGAKHFRVEDKRHTTVRDTRPQAGIFDPNIFDPSIFNVPRLVLDLEDGMTIDVLKVAERIVDHWRRSIP